MSNHLSAIWLAHFACIQYAHAGVWDKPQFKSRLQTKRKVSGELARGVLNAQGTSPLIHVYVCSFLCPSFLVFVI